MHLHHPANTLGAQINIAARASVLRISGGQLITDADALIRCTGFGDGDRASDPKIGISVNGLVQQGRQVTLENPVGLYMQGINTAGFSIPDGSDPQKCWRVIRGQANASVRAVFEPPVGSNFTLDQIEIGGEPLRFGGQLAEKITMFLNALQSPVQPIGAPDPITCPGESDLLIAMSPQR